MLRENRMVRKLHPGQIFEDERGGYIFKLVRIEDVSIPCCDGPDMIHKMWLVVEWNKETDEWGNPHVTSHRGIKYIKRDCRELSKLEKYIRFEE